MSRLKVQIKAIDIGIHSSLSREIDSSSCRLGFYANNGSGKTFLSKAFALYELARSGVPKTSDVNRLLSFGKNAGAFEFSVEGIEPPSQPETLKLTLNRDKGASVEAKSKYKFHVFNSDYVRKNLDERKYSPDGEIKGVILGRENIDVADEEEQVASLRTECSNLEAQIRIDLEGARKELVDLGVRSKTTEFAELSFENLVAEQYSDATPDKFDVLVERYRKLESMPEDLADVVSITVPNFNDIFSEMLEILTKEHSPAAFTEDFKMLMRERNELVRCGLALLVGNECPFCAQALNEQAEALIDKYRNFLDDEEAKVVEATKRLRKACIERREALSESHSEWAKLRSDFEEIKSYLPSSNDLNLSGLKDVATLDSEFRKLDDLLERKESDVTKNFDGVEVKEAISAIREYESQVAAVPAANIKPISEINRRKNDIRGQKLRVKKDLCIARVVGLREALSKERARFKVIGSKIISLETDIRTKRNRNKREKKSEVSKTLTQLLQTFFGDKYSFDENKFCLTFSDSRLAENADDVLSDGEKGIVAFCHYLAMTHCLVETDDDYKNLVFVIDDPISSMDFHFVYKVADCVRRLNEIFPLIGERIRYIILTHNLEFISILGRNNICNQTFTLRNGSIVTTDCSSALPYEPHLQDILRVSAGSEEPNHTTANSIRHTLETIGKFTRPGTSFEKFFKEIEIFKSDPYLWSLIQDQSHGAVRDQPAFIADDIRHSCGLVVDYVESEFPHQVSTIRDRLTTA